MCRNNRYDNTNMHLLILLCTFFFCHVGNVLTQTAALRDATTVPLNDVGNLKNPGAANKTLLDMQQNIFGLPRNISSTGQEISDQNTPIDAVSTSENEVDRKAKLSQSANSNHVNSSGSKIGSESPNGSNLESGILNISESRRNYSTGGPKIHEVSKVNQPFVSWVFQPSIKETTNNSSAVSNISSPISSNNGSDLPRNGSDIKPVVSWTQEPQQKVFKNDSLEFKQNFPPDLTRNTETPNNEGLPVNYRFLNHINTNASTEKPSSIRSDAFAKSTSQQYFTTSNAPDGNNKEKLIGSKEFRRNEGNTEKDINDTIVHKSQLGNLKSLQDALVRWGDKISSRPIIVVENVFIIENIGTFNLKSNSLKNNDLSDSDSVLDDNVEKGNNDQSKSNRRANMFNDLPINKDMLNDFGNLIPKF